MKSLLIGLLLVIPSISQSVSQSSEWSYDNIQEWTMCQCSICNYQHMVAFGLDSSKSYKMEISLNATSTNWLRQNIMGSWREGSFSVCLGRDFLYNECGCLTFTETDNVLSLQTVLGESCINTGNLVSTVYCGNAYGSLTLNGYIRWQEKIDDISSLPEYSTDDSSSSEAVSTGSSSGLSSGLSSDYSSEAVSTGSSSGLSSDYSSESVSTGSSSGLSSDYSSEEGNSYSLSSEGSNNKNNELANDTGVLIKYDDIIIGLTVLVFLLICVILYLLWKKSNHAKQRQVEIQSSQIRV